MKFGSDNMKIEKYLVEDTNRIWTPDEFFYEFSNDIYNLDFFDETFLESANNDELMKESLALFALLGIQHQAQKKAIDFFARKFKFAAMSSAMIWMKKMNLNVRANVGGSVIKPSKKTSKNNPKAGEIVFRDFYNAILDKRKDDNSPIQVVTKGTNTYSWQVFADANKQQSGNRLVFHVDNDADPMGKKISTLTVRIELKGAEKSATLGTKQTGTAVATTAQPKGPQEVKAGSEPLAITNQPKAITSQGNAGKEVAVAGESFIVDMSFLQYLLEADAVEANQGSMVTILETKNGQMLTPFVSLALDKLNKFTFGVNYYSDCIEVFNGKVKDEPEATEEDIQLYKGEKKTGKRKSYNKTGAVEECWEVDFYSSVNMQGKESILSKLTNVLFGGIKGGVGNVATAGADFLGAKTMTKGKMSPMTPFKFGYIHGDFVIPPMKLKTMYNFPRLVKGNFEAQGNLIENCAWCPVVKKKLDLTDNRLNSIWGIQPATNYEIVLSNNPMEQLTNKKGVPAWVTNVDKYLPTSCENFDLSNCGNLIDLKGLPKDVTDTVDLSATSITYESLQDLSGLKCARLDISNCEGIQWPKVKGASDETVNKEETKTGDAEGQKETKATGTEVTTTEQPKEKTNIVKTENP